MSGTGSWPRVTGYEVSLVETRRAGWGQAWILPLVPSPANQPTLDSRPIPQRRRPHICSSAHLVTRGSTPTLEGGKMPSTQGGRVSHTHRKQCLATLREQGCQGWAAGVPQGVPPTPTQVATTPTHAGAPHYQPPLGPHPSSERLEKIRVVSPRPVQYQLPCLVALRARTDP